MSGNQTYLYKKANNSYKLSDNEFFDIFIGKRVLEKEINSEGIGIPVYSANVFEIFGYIEKQLVDDFNFPSVLWGIDGDWMVRYMPPDQPFYPTDHCGVIRVKKSGILDLRYLAWVLEREGNRIGFSRQHRASTDRIRGLVIMAPLFNEQTEVSSQIDRLETNRSYARTVIASASARRQTVLKKYLE